MKARPHNHDGKTPKSNPSTKSSGATRTGRRPEPLSMSMSASYPGDTPRTDRGDDEARNVATSRDYAESRLRQFCLR